MQRKHWQRTIGSKYKLILIIGVLLAFMAFVQGSSSATRTSSISSPTCPSTASCPSA